MTDAALENAVREHRERAGLSQRALGEAAGVTRQAIIGIEAGRQVPSTSLSLRLAAALGCSVEDLFRIRHTEELLVRVAPRSASGAAVPGEGARVVLGRVGDEWVGHRLSIDAAVPADGLVQSAVPEPASSVAVVGVRPLVDSLQLHRNVLVTGCAPILAPLTQRVASRFKDARATWVATSSQRSLDLLTEGLVHVAGLHLPTTRRGEDAVSVVRRRFPEERMLVVNLTSWRQGFVLPRGNPLAIRTGADLLRRGLRVARREEGAGAQELVRRLLAEEGVDDVRLPGPFAAGHAEVARLVRCDAADVGVAIESVAISAGLDFVPLAEERFDLVIRASVAGTPPVARLLEMIDDPAYRDEIAQLPGYDGSLAGHATTLDAA